MLKLQSKDGTKNVWLVDPVMKFGSSRDNEICLQGDGIATLHGKVHVYEGVVSVEPILGAETYVNEQIISLKTQLKLGDVIRVGLFEFAVTDPSVSKDDPFAKHKAKEEAVESGEATVFRTPPPPKKAAGAAIGSGSGWMLQGMHKSLKNKRYPIDQTMILGRSQECGLSFSYDRLSRQHAEFKLFDGVLFVKDLGSSNGVYHNGQRVEQAKLASGDTVAFDKLEFTVIGPKTGAEVESAAAPAGGMNETVVRSAITPEMLKAAKPQAKAKGKGAKPSPTNAGKPAKQGNGAIFIIAGLIVAVAIVGAAFAFL